MFGLTLPCQLFQGPAVRTWKCVAHFANLLWCKFNHVTNPIMPRSRRRQHSRSRTKSRSRSQSCNRDRDTKRRKIENESPQHKRSDSSEDDRQPEIIENQAVISVTSDSDEVDTTLNTETSEDASKAKPEDSATTSVKTVSIKNLSLSKTPKKPLTPKQVRKQMESEERKQEREKVKEEKLKMLEEKKKIKLEENEKRIKEKQEKLEQKQKEIEERQKIRDLKDEKRKKEREEKELKRKEKEEKEELKRKEQDEKSKEKQKLEEKKQKTVAAFVSFFTKKTDVPSEEKKPEEYTTSSFMPFEVKSDMRLAPTLRVVLDNDKKNYLRDVLQNQTERTYLQDLKHGNKIRKSGKTWPFADLETHEYDVMIVEDVNPGESIEEQRKSSIKHRAKLFKFDGNRRPAYFGTWRKKSAIIKPRKPFAIDNTFFDYDFNSDEDWEEDDSGESLPGSDEDKENDSENEYEVDDQFFVPHGHLSDDEVNDEEGAVVSPEAHKAKLKLLKKEFDEEMKSKTGRIKPRLIGCIWYNKDESNVDSAIDEFLKPLSIISNGPIVIKKRSKNIGSTQVRRSFVPGKELSDEFIPDFLRRIHGSTKSGKSLAEEFLNSLVRQNVSVEVSKTSLGKQLKKFAAWTRCPEGGPVLKKYCWFVHKNIGEEYKVDLPVPF